MINRQISALLLLGLLGASGGAQESETRKVVRGVIPFVREWLPPGLIVVAEDLGQSSLNQTELQALARDLGATTGRTSDRLTCVGGGTPTARRQVCKISGATTLFGMSEPTIQDTSAIVTVYWQYQASHERVAARAIELELRRDPNGSWKILKVLSRMMS